MTKLKLTGNSKLLKKTKSGINQKELSLALSEATKCGAGISTKRGFISLPNFNSETGERNNFYGLYVSDGELVVDTIANVKEGTNPNCGNGGGGGTQALRLTFDSIENANLLVGDASNVADWNTFFDLPTYGNPFTSVEVVGNEVRLFGGSSIELKDSLFDFEYSLKTCLLSIVDSAGCIIGAGYSSLGNDAFNGSTSLNNIILPELTYCGPYCFSGRQNITNVNIYIPKCTNLGGTVGENNVFDNTFGIIFVLTIPSSLMTANSGSPDVDILALQGNNTVTIITV